MPVNYQPVAADQLHPVAGLRIGTAMAGIRKANRRDLVLFALDEGCAVAGVFTKNRFCAAPVQVCREHLAAGHGIRALVINTGNANAGTGADGLARARAPAPPWPPDGGGPQAGAAVFHRRDHGDAAGRPHRGRAAGRAGRPAPDNWAAGRAGHHDHRHGAQGGVAPGDHRRPLGHVTGISKGAGMIRPNMATMLGFMATDAVIDPALLQALVQQAADASFNRITIDGDTSTNDSFVLVATQRAGHAAITDAGLARRPGAAPTP
jgi:glutamate N-acetyltransferase / amino-acid N-acetyltransferase